MSEDYFEYLESLSEQERKRVRRNFGNASRLDLQLVSEQITGAILSVAEVVMAMDGHNKKSKARLEEVTSSLKSLIRVMAFTRDDKFPDTNFMNVSEDEDGEGNG